MKYLLPILFAVIGFNYSSAAIADPACAAGGTPHTEVWSCTLPAAESAICAPGGFTGIATTLGYTKAEAFLKQFENWALHFPTCAQAVLDGKAVCKKVM